MRSSFATPRHPGRTRPRAAGRHRHDPDGRRHRRFAIHPGRRRVGSLRASAILADNLKQLAADALEAGMADLEISGGHVRVAGTDRAVSFADLAKLPRATPGC